MKWLSEKKSGGTVEYWETVADVLAAMLLILLLIDMLLLLYIVRSKENDEQYAAPTPTPVVYDGRHGDHDGDADGWGGWGGYYREDDDDDGGGGEETPRPTPTPTPTPAPTPMPDFDEPFRGKGAVLVRVTDAETERLIREEGVRFELYSAGGALQRLFSYYPAKEELASFATAENGTFYFPEKILLDSYYLHETTEPTGYDAAPDTAFFLGSDYDWPEPYSVEVRLYPSRNVICVQMKDAVSGEAVPGGSFSVTADGDIVTMDGTVRYTDGQTVDSIVCDESGFGSGRELYLGRYILQEADIPQYYAASGELLYTRTEKKAGEELPAAIELLARKTEVVLSVVDELYPDLPVSNACFVVYENDAERETLLSDSNGKVSLTDLNKNTQYRLVQTAGDNRYFPSGTEYVFYVDENGWIEGESTASEQIVNRTLRLSLTVKDALLPGNTDTRSVALYNAAGELAASWNTNGTAYVADGLSAGTYEIHVNGKAVKTVEIHDTAQLQTETVSIWTKASVVTAGISCAVTAGAAAAVLVYGVKKKRTKQENK